jgi:hypothetical protein
MRTFKIAKPYTGPKDKFKTKKQRKAAMADGVCKARLSRSGLWDDTRAKSSLKVYRVGEEPKI